MALYFIKGYDNLYSALHGMERSEIIECSNHNEAIDFAQDLSYNVIQDYAEIYDYLEENVQEICENEGILYGNNTEEEDRIREEVFREDAMYEVYLLDMNEIENRKLTIDDLEDFLYYDEETFKKHFVYEQIV